MRKRLILFFLLVPTLCLGQSRSNRLVPKWMHSIPKSESSVITYETVFLIDPNVRSVEAEALSQLSRNLGNNAIVKEDAIVVSSEELVNNRRGRLIDGRFKRSDEIRRNIEGEAVQINYMLADEWWGRKRGQNLYYALYQLSSTPNVVYDNVYATNRYGISPFFMSVIPGVGQFYKGDPVKGSIFMGGCVATGVGAFFLENQRQACENQLSQTHDINMIRKLSADQQNYATARNVTIGITAALYLYNLIDAAIAPGARRVKVKPGGVNFNF